MRFQPNRTDGHQQAGPQQSHRKANHLKATFKARDAETKAIWTHKSSRAGTELQRSSQRARVRADRPREPDPTRASSAASPRRGSRSRGRKRGRSGSRPRAATRTAFLTSPAKLRTVQLDWASIRSIKSPSPRRRPGEMLGGLRGGFGVSCFLLVPC